MNRGPKSSLQLYRDCMRLVKHLAGTTSQKSSQLRKIVSDQFRAHKDELDPARLHHLKQAAERGLSNYLLFERARADPKIAQHMVKTDKFTDDEHGNLVRLEDAQRAGAVTSGVVIGASGKTFAAGAPGGEPVVVKRKAAAASAAAAAAAASAAASATPHVLGAAGW